MNEEQITSRVTLCPDGKYRWVYEVNLYRNPTILIDLIKAVVYIFLAMYVFFFIYGWIDDWFRIKSLQDLLENLWGMAVPFFWMMLFLVAVCIISYYIGARGSGGVYAAVFEMDGQGVLHAQMSSQVKKQQAVNAIAAMAGLVTDEPGLVASSILSSTFTAWKSDFTKVRKVKPVRRRDLIKVNELLTKNRIFVDAPEDYEFVLDFIRQRCPRVKWK
jgi:hypothetical protein